MSRRNLLISAVFFIGCHATAASADEILYRYDGDVLPYDESAGWEVFNPCEGPCSESLADGHFLLSWMDSGDFVNYSYLIAGPSDAPPFALGRVAISL